MILRSPAPFALFSLFFTMLFTQFAPAAPDPLAAEIPSAQVEHHTLPNGLTILFKEDRSAPVVSLQAWVGTGSIHEGQWLGAGLSHILEHMLFKGTERRPAGEIARAIQDQGGYINAYTTFDRTVYWIDVPSSGASEALDILCDAMMHSTLPEDEYTKEQEVIRREFAMGFDDPNREGIQLLLRTLFPDSPHGIPVIGHLDIYNRLTRDDVMAYYKARYVPNNITLVIAGDFDRTALLTQIEEFFKEIPRQALAPVLVPEEPSQLGRREAHEEFPTELTRLYFAWRIPGLDHPDAPALEILGSILGSGRSSILNQEIRERQKLAHSISAGVYSMQTQGVFYVGAVCDPGQRLPIEKEVLSQIEKIKKDGVPESELTKARRSMLSSLIGSLTTARGQASSIGGDWLLTRNPTFSQDFLTALANVTTADVQRVARQYLPVDRLAITSLNPEDSLEAQAASTPAAPASEIKKFTLSNGLRLLVREDPRLPLVSATAAFRGGLLAESPANNGITRLLSQSLLKGTTTRSAEDIARQIEEVGGDIGADAGNNSLSVSVEVLRPDLSLGLELLADVLTNPTFPAEEVALEKNSQIAAIKAEEDQITSVARNLIRSHLFENHPYALRNNGTPDSLASLSPADLAAFHREFITARNGVLAVFGAVQADEVVALAEKAFAKLPAGKLQLTDAPQSSTPTKEIQVAEQRDKQQAVVMVGYRGASLDSPDRPALELLASASSDLGSRFFDRIREQMGLAYFVGASQMNGLAPGLFVFYVGTDPLKVDKVTVALRDEINSLARDGLTPEELERARKKLLGAEAIRNQSNAAFASSSAINELVGLGHDHHLRRRAEIEAVSLDDIRRVAAQYLLNAHPVQATVLPPVKSTNPAESSPANPT